LLGEVILSGAIASLHPGKGDRIQQLQQQIEAWQALLDKLGGNE
jgi:hypothetical protein